MMEKESGSWNMLEDDFLTLERTPEVVTGWSMVPHVGIGCCVLEKDFSILEQSFWCWNRLKWESTCWNLIFGVGVGL